MPFPSLNFARRSLVPLAPALLAALTACAPGQDDPTPSAGRLDVSRYLAVGDGYGSGYAEGVLTRTGQLTGYPALLARQLRRAGAPAAFEQALLPEGRPAAYGGPACSGSQPVPVFGPRAAALPQDLTVPGLRLAATATPGYGNAATPGFNPYFERLLPAPNANTTYLEAVTAAAPAATFFTYFAGLADILPFLQSGGTCGTLPSLAVFNQRAERLLDQLAAGGRRGIIASLPSLQQKGAPTPSGAPTTVSTFPLLEKAAVVQARFQVPTDSALLYFTESQVQFGVQPVDENQYVLAGAVARIGRLEPVVVNGITLQLPYGRDRRHPLVNADVIDAKEYGDMDDLIVGHNTYLKLLATNKYRLPSLEPPAVDRGATVLNTDNAVFVRASRGLSVGGVQYSAVPGGGGLFLSDGISLSPRGNGLMTNAFISALNVAYGANIPSVDINTLPTTAR